MCSECGCGVCQVFWAIGACFEVLLALLVMPSLGWQWLLGLSALPLLVFAVCCVVSARETPMSHVLFERGIISA